jgi:ketosteroid isomerase-like protein
MNRKYGVLIFLIGSLSSSLVAASNGKQVMNTEETQVVNTVENMTSAFIAKDLTKVIASYETGAAVMFEPGNKISDPAVIKEMFKGFFQANPNFSYPKGHEVYIANDIALHISPWVMTGKAPDGTSMQQQGLSVAVLRKQKNGDWLLVLDNPHGQRLIEQ